MLDHGTWAKLERDGEGRVTDWHPLGHHCADVGAVTEALLNSAILGKRLAQLIGRNELSKVQVARLSLLASLHDAGKVNHGFQDRWQKDHGPFIGHVRPLVDFMEWDGEEKSAIIESLGLEQLFQWFESEEHFIAMLLATFCHHGRPEKPGPAFRPELWRANQRRDPMAELQGLAKAAAQWFPESFEEDIQPFPGATEFPHAFNGIVTLADWIASDSTFFPFSSPGKKRIADAQGYADRALRKLGLNPTPARESLGGQRPGFSTVSEYTPRPIQAACMQLPDHIDGSLTILESETGSGKTEAALVRFVQLFRAGLVDGMYFALPTRTAATQLHGRVVEAMERAFPDSHSRPPVVLAVPRYLSVDRMRGRRLAPFHVLWDDNENDRWKYRGWAAENSKRYLAGAVAVGTIDQVLLSCLQAKHSHLRASALMRHLLVVDEVHASDVYMGRLLEEVLDYHLKAGGHALLMSATLGSAARSTFIGEKAVPVSGCEEAKTLSYPFVVQVTSDREKSQSLSPRTRKSKKEVHIEISPAAVHPEKIARLALDAAEQGARVLIVRNTVADCVRTQLALEWLSKKPSSLFRAGGIIAPHHARFAVPDREKLDTSLEEVLGKKGIADGIVVAATQTVEQSLDLDADLMLSDLCPADVLLQRLGRLHRHPETRTVEDRPSHFREPHLVLLVPEERSLAEHISLKGSSGGQAFGPHGLGTVYKDLRVLEATWRFAESSNRWVIPDMNREIVESTTHPEILKQIVKDGGDMWLQHQNYIRGLRSAHISHAGLVLLPRDKPFGTEGFSSELDDQLQTRLGLNDRRAILSDPVVGPFGEEITEFTIPGHLVRTEEQSDHEIADFVNDGEKLTFNYCGTEYIYDRLGLRLADANYGEELNDE
ncbi:MAG: CRISPR-associated helicase Cas3' [Planctomycetes bacterium]|nr:CRISPR-associated helicase Cas3' [Planctomycetota bacterium]